MDKSDIVAGNTIQTEHGDGIAINLWFLASQICEKDPECLIICQSNDVFILSKLLRHPDFYQSPNADQYLCYTSYPGIECDSNYGSLEQSKSDSNFECE